MFDYEIQKRRYNWIKTKIILHKFFDFLCTFQIILTVPQLSNYDFLIFYIENKHWTFARKLFKINYIVSAKEKLVI